MSDLGLSPIKQGIKKTLSSSSISTCLTGQQGVLTNLNSNFDLVGRDAWLFISIKNRRFNRIYLNWFIDFCDEVGLSGHICPVDTPYRYNRMAEMGRDYLQEGEEARIVQRSNEIVSMAKKGINGKRSNLVDIVRWAELESATPEVYLNELREAFYSGSRLRDMLFEHIACVKELNSEKTFERYAEFFLSEVPVLMQTYYGQGSVLDVYPGPQAEFLWSLELGEFKDELPELSKLAHSGESLLYFETSLPLQSERILQL
jgi:hypothetical protein